MKLEAWSLTDVGNVRENNEDSHYVDLENGIFVVADGVGGSQAGEVASELLVERVGERSAEIAELVREKDPVTDREHRERVFAFLLQMVNDVNDEIFQLGKELNPNLPSATTCDILVITQGAAFIAHVGDSRVYLFRDDEIFRITEDHTFSEQLRRENVSDERMLERYKNVLTRSIGGKPQVDVDALFIDLRPGDRVLMCSDGLTDYLTGPEIREYAAGHDGEELLSTLVDEAKARGGHDNITSLLIGVRQLEDTAESAPVREGFDTLKQVDILGQISVFENLNLRELIRVLRIVYEQAAVEGQEIMLEGDHGENMFIIADGAVDLIEGDRTTRLEAGQNFGAFALVRPASPRWATARSVGRSLLLVVPASRFRDLVEADPALGNKLLWNLLGSAADHIERIMKDQ